MNLHFEERRFSRRILRAKGSFHELFGEQYFAFLSEYPQSTISFLMDKRRLVSFIIHVRQQPELCSIVYSLRLDEDLI